MRKYFLLFTGVKEEFLLLIWIVLVISVHCLTIC